MTKLERMAEAEQERKELLRRYKEGQLKSKEAATLLKLNTEKMRIIRREKE